MFSALRPISLVYFEKVGELQNGLKEDFICLPQPGWCAEAPSVGSSQRIGPHSKDAPPAGSEP
jgi:hypothetical protein